MRQDATWQDTTAQNTGGPAKDVHFEKIHNAVYSGDTGVSGVVAVLS
jgi:hypothetical protein